MKPRARFRHNVAVTAAALVGLVATIPIAGTRWYLAPLLLVPLSIMAWGWRSGVDVSSEALLVRALWGSRRVPWAEVAGFAFQGRRVNVILRDDRTVRLPAVSPDDVPMILKAGKQDLTASAGEPDATDGQ